MGQLKLINIDKDSNYDEWLAFRQNGLGASDIGTLMGLNPYKSKIELFYQKVGVIPIKQDEEWVVRYAAVVGLEALAITIANKLPTWRSEIQVQFNLMGCNDEVLAIRARVWLAQQRLQQSLQQTYTSNFDISQKSSAVQEKESPLTSDDWQNILNHLYKMKNEERLSAVSEGDPRRFQDLAAAIGQTSSKDNPCN